MTGEPEIDVAERTVRAVIATRLLARDGGIILPDGIVTRFFEQNPVVQAQHGMSDELRSAVIGRSLGLKRDARGVESVTQFADTELGREYAYLYGVNEEKEIYMRGWSFGWRTLEMAFWSLKQAREFLAEDWNEDVVSGLMANLDEVWVAKRCEMTEYSAVAVGADREALSRAFGDGVRTAGELITDMDLREATRLVGELRREVDHNNARIRKAERDIQALRGEGASAAARGDSEAIARELRGMVRGVRREQPA